MSFRPATVVYSAVLFSTVMLFGFSNVLAGEELDPGPWLDLHTGGYSVGPAQGKTDAEYGSLKDGSVMPAQGPGFQSVSGRQSSAGAGHMISLLQNSSAAFNQKYPQIVIRIGDISQIAGGHFSPPHKSHQNGLDADILFVGATDWRSMIDSDGKISPRFNPDLNWEYWRSLVGQKINVNGKIDSVVSMILVSPEIKAHLCDWASRQGLLSDPENIAVMRRIRPTAGHDGHFHLRLRCSPFHPECQGNFTSPSATGCP